MKSAVRAAAVLAAAVPAIAFAGVAQISAPDNSVGQGNGSTTPLLLLVQRTGDASFPVTLTVAIDPDSSAAHPAVLDTDYSAGPTSVTLGAGSVLDSVTVSALKVGAGQPDRGLLLTLSAPDFPRFQPRADANIGHNPNSAAQADLNGDGKPDLIVAKNSVGAVGVLLNASTLGSPGFGAQTEVTAAGTTTSAAIAADFDGDGKPDIATTTNANTLVVLRNTTAANATTPTFAAPLSIAVSDIPGILVAADFNGDGRLDIAIGHKTYSGSAGSNVSVLLNTTVSAGAITFASPKTFEAGHFAVGLAAADLDADGRPDLVTANLGDGTVSILRNTTAALAATASFAAQQTVAVGTEPEAVVAADFNGDGKPDLAVANNGSQSVSLLTNQTATPGAASFSAQTVAGMGNTAALAVADFDADGNPDLVVPETYSYSNGESTVRVLLNHTAHAATSLTFQQLPSLLVGGVPTGVVAIDLDGDTVPDLVTANALNDATSLSVLEGNAVSLAQPTAHGTLLATVQPFAFAHFINLHRNMAVYSDLITVSGIAYTAPVSVTNGSYSINHGALRNGDSFVFNGDTVEAEIQSSAHYSTDVTMTVTIGGVSADFVATTERAPPAASGGSVDPRALGLMLALLLMRSRRRLPGV